MSLPSGKKESFGKERCAVCGTPGDLFYSGIEDQRTYCHTCFNDPNLWIPTKERVEEVKRYWEEHARKHPMQTPLTLYMGGTK